MPNQYVNTSRDIRRHPLREFRKQLKAGEISRLPQLRSDFKVAIPADEDFVVRFRGRGARPIRVVFLRGGNGAMTAFAHERIEIEFIGTNDARRARSLATEKRAKARQSRR